MTDSSAPQDLAFGRQIRALADAGASERDPDVVVQAVFAGTGPRRVARMPLALLASAGVLILFAVVAIGTLSNSGSSPATAHVGGITIGGFNLASTDYGVAVARSIDLSDARLTPVGEARQDSGIRTQGAAIYQVDDLDPLHVLVMRLEPGQRDDSGSLGDYLLLVRGDGFSLVCPYFHEGDPLAPTVCD